MDSKVPILGGGDRPGAALGLGMAKFPLSLMSGKARSALVAALCLGGASVVLLLQTRAEPRLAAATNQGRSDLDGDGLTDEQELVIGTLPNRADTDGDGYSDLEERARGSDPLSRNSVPDPNDYGLGTCASLEDGVISMLSAVYLHNRPVDAVNLEIGIVYRGRVLQFKPKSFTNARGFLYAGHDSGDTLAVVEVAIPEALVQRLGQVNMFSIVRDATPGGGDPMVSVLPLVNFSGVTTMVEPRRATMTISGGQPTGVVYRPLGGGGHIPSTWNGGEICFQRTTAVGMNGVSIVHEVEAADCLPMDTYCSPADCSAGVGKPLELPDPAALAGG